MKIMCIIKINCPINNGIAPFLFPPTIEKSEWLQNFKKYTKFNCDGYVKHDLLNNLLEDAYYSSGSNNYKERTNYNTVFLFDSEEELTTWANNCRLIDSQLIADQETWKTAHGITFTYEYYLLSPTTGPDPVI